MRPSQLFFACGLLAFASCTPPDSTPSVNAEHGDASREGRHASPEGRHALREGTHASQEGYVEALDAAKLFYRMLGSGPDTLVVLHGGPGFTMDYFYADLEPLSTGHALLFYDQRGTGKSTLVSDSAALDGDSFVADLEAIRAHFGMERMVLLGHSWGAGVAALYAQQHPERVARMVVVGAIPLQRSVLLDGFAVMAANRDSVSRRLLEEWREVRLANPGDRAACRAYYALWFEPFVADRAAFSRSKGDFCAGSPESLRNKINSVDRYTAASLGDWDWRSSLREMDAPTLVIHGTVDPLPLAGAREWSRALPNARMLELNGIGHFPYLEAPDVFFTSVDHFLRGEWPESARIVSQ